MHSQGSLAPSRYHNPVAWYARAALQMRLIHQTALSPSAVARQLQEVPVPMDGTVKRRFSALAGPFHPCYDAVWTVQESVAASGVS